MYAIRSYYESNLGIECAPLTWPIGMGKLFQGVYDLRSNLIRFFEVETKGTKPRESAVIKGLDDPELDRLIGEARITSYNVCYTKLLRCRPKQMFCPSRIRLALPGQPDLQASKLHLYASVQIQP